MFIQVEDKEGTGLKNIEEKGLVKVNITSNIYDNKYICVDDYEGRGDNYRKRKESKIIIRNGQETFEFENFNKLIEQLKKQ